MTEVLAIGFGVTLAFVLGYVFAEVTRSTREFVDDADDDDHHDEDEDDVVG